MRRGLRAVRQHWAGARPSLVHTHILFRPAALAWWLKTWHGLPYLITENWTAFQPGNVERLGRTRRWLAGFLVRQAAAYTPVSDDLRRALAALGGVNAHTRIIPNVVDTELFHLPPVPAARFGLLNVAAFNEQAKNLSGLLRAVARLRAAYPPARPAPARGRLRPGRGPDAPAGRRPGPAGRWHGRVSGQAHLSPGSGGNATGQLLRVVFQLRKPALRAHRGPGQRPAGRGHPRQWCARTAAARRPRLACWCHPPTRRPWPQPYAPYLPPPPAASTRRRCGRGPWPNSAIRPWGGPSGRFMPVFWGDERAPLAA
ncbi:MAG: glycosyltransferase [Hymenobacter sp.]